MPNRPRRTARTNLTKRTSPPIRRAPSLTRRLQAMASSKSAVWVLAAVSFTESFVFFIPPDVLLIPMVLAARSRAWVIAGICTLASVAGALVGYGIGALAFDAFGERLLDLYGYDERFESFGSDYNNYGSWAVLVAGVTPLPFKVVTIISGVTGLNLATFVISCLIARGARFFLVAAVLWKFGPLARDLLERRMGEVMALVAVVAVFILLALVFLP